MGSSLDARSAGTPQATAAMTRKPTIMAANVAGSVGSTPTSIVRIALVKSSAAANPSPMPGAKRHADAYFRGPLAHGRREHAIQADGGEYQCHACEDADQHE